jgi:hypothetical protein
MTNLYKEIPILDDLVDEVIFMLPYLEYYDKIVVSDSVRKQWYNSQVNIKKTKKFTEYKIDGKLHRDNELPAVIYEDGSVSYYFDGVFIK